MNSHGNRPLYLLKDVQDEFFDRNPKCTYLPYGGDLLVVKAKLHRMEREEHVCIIIRLVGGLNLAGKEKDWTDSLKDGNSKKDQSNLLENP